MPKWTKGNTGYAGKGKGQGKSTLPTDVPARFESGFIDLVDGRCRAGKAVRGTMESLYANTGGKENVSFMEQIIFEKIAFIKWMTRKTELTLIQGGSIDEAAYLNAVNCLSGLLSKIGLKRRAKLLPSLSDYLDAKKKPEPQAPSPAPSSGPQHKEDIHVDGNGHDESQVSAR